ncbi:MAG: hypothetical protein H6625_07410 [Bdellovibrionaceae bacterium]|nr:hypothetical protein [Pseudobdellovibrionaceae bacterium]
MKRIIVILSLMTISFTVNAETQTSGRCNINANSKGFEIQVGEKSAYQTDNYELAKLIFRDFEKAGVCAETNKFCSFELKDGEYVVRNQGLSGVISANILEVQDIFKYLVRSGVCSSPEMRCLFASQGNEFVALHDGQIYGKQENAYRVGLWLRDLMEKGQCLPESNAK